MNSGAGNFLPFCAEVVDLVTYPNLAYNPLPSFLSFPVLDDNIREPFHDVDCDFGVYVGFDYEDGGVIEYLYSGR